AWHLAAAATAPDEDVAAALEEEARRVWLRGGYISSARTRVRAADMTPDAAGRVERLLEAVGDFELGGSFEEAERVLADARSHTEDPATLARIRGVEASLLLRRGHAREAREALLAQARFLADRLPTASARFFLQSAFASMTNAEVETWEEHARSALAVVPESEARTRLVGQAMLAAALVATSRLDEAEPLVGAVTERLLGGEEPIGGAVEVYALMARSLIWIERFSEAREILERLDRDARRLNVIAGLPYILNMRASLETHVGRWSAAEVAVEEQVSLARDTGDDLFLHAGLSTRAWLAAVRGDEEACVTAAQAALGGATDLNLSITVWSHYSLGLLALGRGDMETAVHELGWMADRAGFPEPGSRPWEPDLIEALVRAGDPDRAGERLDAWEAVATRTGRRLALATAARCRGLLVADEEIDAAFGSAMELHEQVPNPFQRARTLYCLGERLRRARRRADARAPLRDALAIFERLGAQDWAAKSRTELRATGGMVPIQAREELEDLTPHELQVALLVAEGRTNREVAAALFLAPKTIEHHLSAIFRKLDVSRRTELARVFAAELGNH
ncbi:MAG TPA: LuxR C-terminal-related transcriptional regulator, partial [Solirubrobacteraceae bacterium]|nr:LuxR C-terminal-related transcriptional regulator [Solirubrobacteraceae bacterium]